MAATNSRKNYKKNYKKKPGGELIWKNSGWMVFRYRRRFSLSVRFSCLFVQKTSISEPSPWRFATSVPNYSPYRNSLPVVFLVREGPLRVLRLKFAIFCDWSIREACGKFVFLHFGNWKHCAATFPRLRFLGTLSWCHCWHHKAGHERHRIDKACSRSTPENMVRVGEGLTCWVSTQPQAHIILFRDAPDMFKFLRHVMRSILSVRPKCSHRRASVKETPLKPV